MITHVSPHFDCTVTQYLAQSMPTGALCCRFGSPVRPFSHLTGLLRCSDLLNAELRRGPFYPRQCWCGRIRLTRNRDRNASPTPVSLPVQCELTRYSKKKINTCTMFKSLFVGEVFLNLSLKHLIGRIFNSHQDFYLRTDKPCSNTVYHSPDRNDRIWVYLNTS